jgi:dipeptidyl aminopeptidase/acylaminoacyl peptidase
MTLTRIPILVLLGIATWGAVGHAQAVVPGPSFEQVISLRSAGSPAISPDGHHVAFTIRTADWKENRFDTEIWLSRDGGVPTQLTRTPKGNSTSPRWSPDGQWIAFLADRGDKQQVYLIGLAGGEAVRATSATDGVSDFRWAPDGRRIAYTATEPSPESMTRRKERYGEFAIEDADYLMSHLWMVEVPGEGPGDGPAAPATRLTEGGGFTVGSFDWSPDGTEIAFDHQASPLINAGASADISVVNVQTRSIRPLVVAPGADQGPTWSPDGRWIAYSSDGGDTTSNYYRNNQVMRIASTGGRPDRLGAQFDEQIGGVQWTPLGIYFSALERTRRHLYRLDPETGRVSRAASTELNVGTPSFSSDGRTVAFTGSSSTTLGEVYLTSLASFNPRAVTALTDQIGNWSVGPAEVVSWKSRDGTTIEGVLHKPRDFDPAKRYPLLVVIHGGPTGIDLPQPIAGSVYPITQWTAGGALVLRPNYRGSAGYGEKFRSLNVQNLGVGDMWDVMSGVDYLIGQGIVDTARMGAMGWSQGGYISAFLTTNTSQFKAISVGAGISNWVTYYVATDIHPFTRQYLKATPWADEAIYRKTSPMTTIRQARTPTQIQHGEFDRRVPIQNAYELFQGLEDQGVPTRLIVYKGFGHGITKPKEQLAAVWHNWQWFSRYVFGTEVELPLVPAGDGPVKP